MTCPFLHYESGREGRKRALVAGQRLVSEMARVSILTKIFEDQGRRLGVSGAKLLPAALYPGIRSCPYPGSTQHTANDNVANARRGASFSALVCNATHNVRTA